MEDDQNDESNPSSPSDVEEMDEDKFENKKCEEENDSDDGDVDMDEVQDCESHSSKCNIDYRLYTFQDMGRYMKNNPGSYYDHSKNLWFCSVCQNFGGAGKQRNAWVDKGVKLGATPGRVFQRHFSSDFHRKNVEFKQLFGNMRREEKSSHIIKLFKQYNGNEGDKVGENRSVFKILFRTCHYIIKKMMSNQTYESLVRLISKLVVQMFLKSS